MYTAQEVGKRAFESWKALTESAEQRAKEILENQENTTIIESAIREGYTGCCLYVNEQCARYAARRLLIQNGFKAVCPRNPERAGEIRVSWSNHYWPWSRKLEK